MHSRVARAGFLVVAICAMAMAPGARAQETRAQREAAVASLLPALTCKTTEIQVKQSADGYRGFVKFEFAAEGCAAFDDEVIGGSINDWAASAVRICTKLLNITQAPKRGPESRECLFGVPTADERLFAAMFNALRTGTSGHSQVCTALPLAAPPPNQPAGPLDPFFAELQPGATWRDVEDLLKKNGFLYLGAPQPSYVRDIVVGVDRDRGVELAMTVFKIWPGLGAASAGDEPKGMCYNTL